MAEGVSGRRGLKRKAGDDPGLGQCALPHCPHPTDSPTYFKVPDANSAMREKWLDACQIQQFNQDDPKICGLHFKDTDFYKEPKARLLILP